MAIPEENKIQQFQDARDTIVGGITALAPKSPEEALQHVFAIAHGEGMQRKQTDLVQQVREGTLDFDQLSIRVDGSAMIMLANHVQKLKADQANRTKMLLAMLDDIANLTDQLRDLNEAIDERSDILLEKYDGIEGLKEAFLTQEEAQGLETLEDVYEAMVDKYLNADGTLKPGAEHVDPLVLEQLRDFQEAQGIAAEIGGMVSSVAETGVALTADQRIQVDEAMATAKPYQKAAALEAASGSELVQEALTESNRNIQVASAEAESSGGFTIPMG